VARARSRPDLRPLSLEGPLDLDLRGPRPRTDVPCALGLNSLSAWGVQLRRFSCPVSFALGIVALALIAGCSPASEAVQTKAPETTAPQPTSPAPSPQPAVPESVVSDLKSVSAIQHYKTASGYSTTIRETIWHPLPTDIAGPAQHPAGDGATIDPSSDYDPKTDVVVPFRLTLTNTTKGFAIEKPTIDYSVESIGAAEAQTYDMMSLEAWDWHSDGWSTTKYNVGGVVDGQLAVRPSDVSAGTADTEWSDPLAPGASVTVNGFFVYRDKLTPAKPKGTRWVLDNLSLEFWGQGNRSDKHPHTLTLSGKLVPGGL